MDFHIIIFRKLEDALASFQVPCYFACTYFMPHVVGTGGVGLGEMRPAGG
jgi:hypothetical protein